MFRLWGKIMKNNRFVMDYVFETSRFDLTRDEKVNLGIDALILHFDIQKPMWLVDNQKDYEQFGKVRFHHDHFIETINFDYFEIEIIDDDDNKN